MSAAMSRKKSWLPAASLAESLNSFPSFIPSDLHVKREIGASWGSNTSFATAVPSVCGKLVSKVKISGFRSRVPTTNFDKEAPAQPSLQNPARQLHSPDKNREPLGHCPGGYLDGLPSWSFEISSGVGFNVERSGSAHSPTPAVLASSSPVAAQLSVYTPKKARRGASSGSDIALVSEGVVLQSTKGRKPTVQNASLPALEDQPQIARRPTKGKARVPLRSQAVANLRSTKSRGGLIEQLLCGGFAGIVSRTAVAPIDLVRVSCCWKVGVPGSGAKAL